MRWPAAGRGGGEHQGALLLNYAGKDDNVNAGIPGFREALDKAGVRYELQMYEGAQHAFHNDTSEARYDAAAAKLAGSGRSSSSSATSPKLPRRRGLAPTAGPT
jgi:dienelactone hydrolase